MIHETPAPPIFNQDGSINEGVLIDRYGLGMAEATQQVKFGDYTGTVAEMLNDARCPVGGKIRDAYKGTGIDGVIEQFEALNIMVRDFKIEITAPTIERAREKKSRATGDPQ